MPRTKMNYNNTVMYKLVCKDLNVKDIYVGSTTNFIERKANHKNKCNCESNQNHQYKVYQMIRDSGGWDNWEMIQIETFPCENGNEARARERYWYEELHANMNTRNPFYSQENNKEKMKQYAENSKAYMNECVVCECGTSYTRKSKYKHLKIKKHIQFMSSSKTKKDNICNK